MPQQPTIREVARVAGVSKATVARVVNGELGLVKPATAARVLDAVRLLGYERNAIAGSLRTNRTRVVAVAIPDISNPFWPEVARGIQDTLDAAGYVTALFNSDWRIERERACLAMARRNRYDGLILKPTHVTDADLATFDGPIVLLGGQHELAGIDSVANDTQRAMELALTHLYEQGHRSIALIAGRKAASGPSAREHAFVRFHASRGILFDEELIVYEEFTVSGGTRATRVLLARSPRPTAILAANDQLAGGAILAVRDAGLSVPEDVSIVGTDDIDAAAVMGPPLTTVAKEKYVLGRRAAEFLLDRMGGGNAAGAGGRHVKLACRLVIRASTAPPNAGA